MSKVIFNNFKLEASSPCCGGYRGCKDKECDSTKDICIECLQDSKDALDEIEKAYKAYDEFITNTKNNLE